MYKYLFGPVSSRRLGRSLGVDLVPMKTCSFNCIFCQAGQSSVLTTERREYVPAEDVIAEFESWHASGGTADYVTFSGSGEPTLNSRIGDVISAIRTITGIPMALLTNGSLLHLSEVRDEVSHVNLIKASLSAWDDETLMRLNRPALNCSVESIVSGISLLRRQFDGELWIEVFLVEGVNDSMAGVGRIAEMLRDLGPDKIQLNTVVRRPAESTARPVDSAKLEDFAGLFTPRAEIIAPVQPAALPGEVGARPLM